MAAPYEHPVVPVEDRMPKEGAAHFIQVQVPKGSDAAKKTDWLTMGGSDKTVDDLENPAMGSVAYTMGFDYADLHHMQHSSQQLKLKKQQALAQKNSELAAFREAAASAALRSDNSGPEAAAPSPSVSVAPKVPLNEPPIAAKLKRKLKSNTTGKSKQSDAPAKTSKKDAVPTERESKAPSPSTTETREIEAPSLLGSLVGYSSGEDS